MRYSLYKYIYYTLQNTRYLSEGEVPCSVHAAVTRSVIYNSVWDRRSNRLTDTGTCESAYCSAAMRASSSALALARALALSAFFCSKVMGPRGLRSGLGAFFLFSSAIARSSLKRV
nr:MAG TPA: hypothetical protein [Caudoviricetes sp.]